MVGEIKLLHLCSGKAPLKGEARDRVRTSVGINPSSLGTVDASKIAATTLGNHPVRTLVQLLFRLG